LYKQIHSSATTRNCCIHFLLAIIVSIKLSQCNYLGTEKMANDSVRTIRGYPNSSRTGSSCLP
jgi:hypothetical protein